MQHSMLLGGTASAPHTCQPDPFPLPACLPSVLRPHCRPPSTPAPLMLAAWARSPQQSSSWGRLALLLLLLLPLPWPVLAGAGRAGRASISPR